MNRRAGFWPIEGFAARKELAKPPLSADNRRETDAPRPNGKNGAIGFMIIFMPYFWNDENEMLVRKRKGSKAAAGGSNIPTAAMGAGMGMARSEERRVGKECRSR